MAHTRKQEERLLTKDENELVVQSHHPDLAALADGEVSDLLKRLRERRDRARTIAQRQRREMRGKATAQGASPAADDAGSRGKRDVLGKAAGRVAKESAERAAMRART